MTFRQSLMRVFYPVLMKLGKPKKVNNNTTVMQPAISFYSLSAKNNKGEAMSFEQFRGKKVLLVNTASDCGYTPQYADLEKLYTQYKDKLVILGFPANDFGEQEKGSNEEIASFCQVNYGVTFPLMAKSTVIKKPGQNDVFKWLSDKTKNGWNDQEPTWNFCKYLVNEDGELVNFYSSAVAPVELADVIE
ncbi:glutathione peroxidase [Panacibacter sp. DH6]|uniref:Glutathione peroxidase n=2 Tax=Panacibacter microcysteis TaxID=2793269 RepID=A0A931GX86_9BACT|nr:glutathione peroxidase [Panacibacter microcysteis]